MSAEAIPELKTASEINADLLGQSSPTIDEDDPKSQETYTFLFEHTDFRGKIWKGEFSNKILSINDRLRLQVVKSRLTNNTPVEALDADTWVLVDQIAHLAVSLTKKEKWAEDLGALQDTNIIHKLYGEVASHEAYFRGQGNDAAGDKKADAK